jgi:hypothetical protein
MASGDNSMKLSLLSLVLLASSSVYADDIASVPAEVSCTLTGSGFSSESTMQSESRTINLAFLTMPPLRSDLQSLSDAELACLYVAGWRDRAIYGDNFASEKLCYTRQQADTQSVYACQVVGHKREDGRYAFDNMDCENGELDRLSLNDKGLIIASDFASSRQFENHNRDFFLGSGRCQLTK